MESEVSVIWNEFKARTQKKENKKGFCASLSDTPCSLEDAGSSTGPYKEERKSS